MSYTIMSTEDISFNMSVDLSKEGNKYRVSIHHDGEHSGKMFDTLEQALTAYNEQVRLIAFGLYSINDRREILYNGFKSFK